MSTVGVAFVGVGDVSELHASAVQACEGAELVGVWNWKRNDVSAGGHIIDARERANRFGCRLYDTLEQLLEDPKVQAVFVLTPFHTHTALAKRALEACKHVLVEKPVAPTAKEMRSLAELAQKNQVKCVPGHNYVYDPQLVRIREEIQSGSLGQLVHVSIQYNIKHGPEVTANLPGIIDQIMTHHTYTALFLAGEKPVKVSCMTANLNNGSVPHENVALVMMQMKSGAFCLMHANFASDDHSSEPWSFAVKVLGTEGAARYSYNDIVQNSSHTIHSHTYLAYPHTVRELVNHFVHKCVKRGQAELSSLNDAAATLEILNACKESQSSGCHIVLNL